MTEQEAIEILDELGGFCSSEDNYKACHMAIKALEEIRQHREIGTVEECRAAVEKQTAKKPKEYEAKFYGCPTCGNVEIKDCKHCPDCGQALIL